jgi:hypothetical protein
MAERTHQLRRPPALRRGRAAVVACCLFVLAAGVVVAVDRGALRSGGDDATSFAIDHGTVPTLLDTAKVAAIGRAFGIRAHPHHTQSGWEVEDRVRALYLARTSSAWYALFTDSSALLHPEADRTALCAGTTPPEGCASPTARFVVDVGAPPPTADDAVAAARGVLGRAGIVDRRWSSFVIGPSREGVPCRTGVAPELDCTRQQLATQAVMLTHDLGPGRTALNFAVIVGPGGELLTATGRFGKPDTG